MTDTQSRKRIYKFHGYLVLLALAVAAPGCVTTQAWQALREPPAPSVNQAHTYWENRVVVTQDTVNRGAPLAGLAGRLYLFGSEIGYPLKGDGAVIVDLFDVTTLQPGAQPPWLERWELDRDTLGRLLKKDTIGQGYTLFLPWKTYRPEIARVQLNVQYIPAKGGNPIYAPPSLVSLRGEGAIPISSRQVPLSVQQAGLKK